MSLIRKARRHNIPLKLGVRGASGSGKTYSSILLAKGLMGGSLEKVVVIDTENSSADLYSHLGDYSVLPFTAPFEPQRYANAINICVKEGFQCIIIDSTSHEWEEVLKINEKLAKAKYFNNSFRAWAETTPIHEIFVRAILDAPVHVIACMRTKQEYAMEQNEKGKMQPVKVGTKEVMRDNFEFELTACFNIDMNHLSTMSKDRTDLFNDGIPFKITEQIGERIREWNSEQN